VENVNLQIAFIAFVIDYIFGEFFSPHPVVLMGKYISWFEKKFYKDSFLNGFFLGSSLIFLVFLLSFFLEKTLLKIDFLGVIFLGILASSTIANKMLFDSVFKVIKNPNSIKYLVSRDTKNLSSSEINKAAIETYAENLSDGVIAPFFYLIVFGVSGAFVYKAINTLDSMVGYKTKKYQNFGKFSAKIDDLANFIPARITALLIVLCSKKKESFKFYKYAKLHESPNAGFPISAMALALGIKLGGDTFYFGKLKHKPFFGEGRKKITKSDILEALKFKKCIDFLLLLFLIGSFILLNL